MRISDEELELFRDWQPGDSITMDMNSVGMLIQEVIRSRVALRAYNKLEDMQAGNNPQSLNSLRKEKTMAHTPGPWEVDEEMIEEKQREIEIAFLPGCIWIAKVSNHLDVPGIANARLIAAAPELLKIARAALEWIDAVPNNTPLPTMPGFDRDWANDVISKATAAPQQPSEGEKWQSIRK